MSARGVHFAVTPAQAKALLAAKSDRKLMELVEEIEEAWDRANSPNPASIIAAGLI